MNFELVRHDTVKYRLHFSKIDCQKIAAYAQKLLLINGLHDYIFFGNTIVVEIERRCLTVDVKGDLIAKTVDEIQQEIINVIEGILK